MSLIIYHDISFDTLLQMDFQTGPIKKGQSAAAN
jgi:hypothetical protein